MALYTPEQRAIGVALRGMLAHVTLFHMDVYPSPKGEFVVGVLTLGCMAGLSHEELAGDLPWLRPQDIARWLQEPAFVPKDWSPAELDQLCCSVRQKLAEREELSLAA